MPVAVDASPTVAAVAQRFRATSQGVVGFRLHRTFDVHAGFSKRHEDLTFDGVFNNGTLVRVRVVSYTIDGKPASTQAQASLEQQYEHPNPTDVFQPPFDPRYLTAYQYQSSQPGTIAFTSLLRDAAHGNGTFSYDAAGNVVTYNYQPGSLPRYAKSANVTDLRSEVLPGYWAVTQETQQYKGSYGPFPGAATVVITMSNFQRFPDVQSATSAISGARKLERH
jgi:hypothetical protein